MIFAPREPRPPPLKSFSDVPRSQGSWYSQLSSEHKGGTGTRTGQSAGHSQPND